MGNPSGRNAMKVVSITPAAEELILLRVDAERYRLLKALSAETRVRIADIVQHAVYEWLKPKETNHAQIRLRS